MYTEIYILKKVFEDFEFSRFFSLFYLFFPKSFAICYITLKLSHYLLGFCFKELNEVTFFDFKNKTLDQNNSMNFIYQAKRSMQNFKITNFMK
jgi:hypothetical protein